jgi:hypothetical protein
MSVRNLISTFDIGMRSDKDWDLLASDPYRVNEVRRIGRGVSHPIRDRRRIHKRRIKLDDNLSSFELRPHLFRFRRRGLQALD